MPDFTPTHGLVFPVGGDQPVVHADLERLANSADAALTRELPFKGGLLSSYDLDALTQRGRWEVISGAQADNLGLPAHARGYFESIPNRNGGLDLQEFVTAASRPMRYARTWLSGGWTDWEIVGTASLIPLTSSDTLDSLTPGRAYYTAGGATSEALGLPSTIDTPQRGILKVHTLSRDTRDNSVRLLEWTTLSATPGFFVRSKISGVWRDWVRLDIGGIDTESLGRGLPGQVSVWGSSTPAGLVPELSAELRPYGVEVHQKSRGGQWSSQTVANIGSVEIPLYIAGGSIPASGSVEIHAADTMLDGVDQYLSITNEGIPGWLGSVYGRLVGYGTSFNDRGIRFTRDKPGTQVDFTEAPMWVPEIKTPAHLNILGMGKNDLNVGRTQAHLNRVIERKDETIAYWQDRNQAFLILGHFVNRDTPASDAGRTQIEADNADSATKYPDNFINMQELLSGEELWEWTGITPTSEDLAQQALGNMPPSIQGTGNHLSEAGNQYLAWKIAQWMVSHNFIGQGRVPFANLYQAATP